MLNNPRGLVLYAALASPRQLHQLLLWEKVEATPTLRASDTGITPRCVLCLPDSS